MASIKETADPSAVMELRQRLARWALGVLVLAGVAWLAVWWLSRPPQMGTSEDVFNTVDALFTAITSKSQGRLAQCERRLKALSEKGELPDAAARNLTSIIDDAKAGNWQPASARLYTFMLSQRRDGTIEHHEKKGKKANASVASAR